MAKCYSQSRKESRIQAADRPDRTRPAASSKEEVGRRKDTSNCGRVSGWLDDRADSPSTRTVSIKRDGQMLLAVAQGESDPGGRPSRQDPASSSAALSTPKVHQPRVTTAAPSARSLC